MGNQFGRCAEVADRDVRLQEVDVMWIQRMAGWFDQTRIESTAHAAMRNLGQIGVNVSEANAMLEIHRINAQQPNAQQPLPVNVPSEKSLSIHSYTINDVPIFSTVSTLLNDVGSRTTENAKLNAVMPWLKMLDDSVATLPDSYDYVGDGYRGMQHAFPHLETDFAKDKIICWYNFKSAASDPVVMSKPDFCGKLAIPRTVYIIRDMRGKKIKAFSAYPDEEEVLLRPLTFFQVVSAKKGDHLEGDPFDGHADIIELRMLPWKVPRTKVDVLDMLKSGLIQQQDFRAEAAKKSVDPEDAQQQFNAADARFKEEQSRYFNGRGREQARKQVQKALKLLASSRSLCISGSSDRNVGLWNTRTGKLLREFKGHTDYITSVVALGSDRCISGSDDRTIKVWNLASQTCEMTLTGHTDHIRSVVALGSDRCISGSWDKTIKVWNLASQTCEMTLTGHTDVITSVVALGSDRCISGSRDKTIKVWNLASQTCEMTLTGHTDYITSVATFSAEA